MDQTEKLLVFNAQVQNVRELEKAWTHINRTINSLLRIDNETSANIHTKILALVFTSWSEANFSKLIHTPYGFTLDEIAQIKRVSKSNGIGSGWKKSLELGLQKISSPKKSNHSHNIKQTVSRIIDEYVIEPSLIRNKLAHGQWKVALNKDNTDSNNQITNRLLSINIVDLLRWKRAYQSLSNIVELLIESPDRVFNRDYWTEISKLSEKLKETQKWSLEKKILELKLKLSHSNGLNKQQV